MKTIILTLFFLISLTRSYGETQLHYLTFSFSTYPVFINERTNFHSDEYTLIKTENGQNENLKLVDGGGWLDLLSLEYSNTYSDSTIIVDIIDVIGECTDTMKLIFAPFEMKQKYYVIENVYMKNIAFQPGVFRINFPESLADWQDVKSECIYMPKFEKKYTYHKDISSFQRWYGTGLQWHKEELEASEKRYHTFDQYIAFRIYDTLWNEINPSKFSYSVDWTLRIEWNQPLNMDWFKKGLTFDSTNKFYTITYHDEMWEHDELFLFVKGMKDTMTISFRPRILKQRRCSIAEVFIDSIKYKRGYYEVVIPNRVFWNEIKKLHFEGYDKDFYDLTSFQKWRN